MKITTIFLPGNYEDGYLYMGRLLAVTAERSIHVFDMEKIIQDLEDTMPQPQPLFAWLFLRNDWLASAQFESLFGDGEIAAAILSSLNSISSIEPIEISDASSALQAQISLEIPAAIILDMLIYNRRLFLSSETGLYHMDLEWSADTVVFPKKVSKRHDLRCISSSAGFGAVNSSCGEEGLLSSLDDFGWLGGLADRKFEKLAERSIRSAWSGYDLMNYANSASPTLLTAVRETTEGAGDDYDRSVLTSLGEQSIELTTYFKSELEEKNISSDSIEFVFNSSRNMFIHTREGDLFAVGLARSENEPPTITYSRAYEGSPGRILSLHPSNVGLVVEAEDKVLVFSDEEWHPVIQSEAISVRTFIKSRRYKNTVVIVGDEGLYLSSLFNEYPLLKGV